MGFLAERSQGESISSMYTYLCDPEVLEEHLSGVAATSDMVLPLVGIKPKQPVD